MASIAKPFHLSPFEPDIQQKANVNWDETVNYINDRNSGTVAWDNVNSVYQLGFKNRIINGDMRIDQRNAGAAVTVNSITDQFPVDRFNGSGQSTDGVFTLEQTDTTPPDGYNWSTIATVTTADASIGATQNYVFRQQIEGYDIVDAGFGTAWARTLTLSFWVKCSLTGTFGGAFLNNAANRSYPFTYAISAANTWEKKSVTFVADTTGTWEKTTNRGLNVNFALGVGSTYLGPAGAWAATTYYGATGQTNLISTLNATWNITGVQLELGATATAFEFRPIATELAMCQRYFEKTYSLTTAVGTVTTADAVTYRPALADMEQPITFHVNKRVAPTITFYNPQTGAAGSWRDTVTPANMNMTTISIGYWGFSWQNSNSFFVSNRVQGHWTASAEL